MGNKGTEEFDDINLIIRTILPEELEEAFDLVDKEGWNLTLFKFKKICEVFPSDILVTVDRNTQEVIVVVSVIPGLSGEYVVGNLVVKQDYRGQGLGKVMMDRLMHMYKDTLVLTAVPGMDGFYRKLGFRNVDHTHHIYFIEVDRAKVTTACSDQDTDITTTYYSPKHFQNLNSYDKFARGYDAGKYLSVMTEVSDHFLLATSKKTGQVVGYVAGVERGTYLLLDGLYADTDGIALLLFRELLGACPHTKEVKLQVIKDRMFLVQFGQILWPKYHTYTRMAKGPAAAVKLSKLYVVTDCDYSE